MEMMPLALLRKRPIALVVAAAVCGLQLPLVEARPLDVEFQVNTTTDDHQQLADVAMDADGNYVVVFQNHLPVTNANVSAQRYDADGVPQGDEFLVNTTQFSGTTAPAVAMDPDGDFVVVWMDFGDDGSGNGVYAQRYNAAGVAQGANVLVNTTTQDAQQRPDVAIDDDGDFVVVWEDIQISAGDSRRIRAQRFNQAGVAQGGELAVSTDVDIDHTYPKVAMDRDGGFVVGWAAGNVGADQDVVFRRFDAAGQPAGGPVQVNVDTNMDNASGINNNMSLDSDGDGNFVVAWRADNVSGPGVVGAAVGLLARRYDSLGNPLGDAFEVDTTSAAFINAPEVAVGTDGQFSIAYEAADGSLMGVKIQRYHGTGQPIGAPFLANTTTQSVQSRPAIALDGDGIVAWQSADGNGLGIFARSLSGVGIGPGLVDFNHDFRGDIVFRNTSSGRNQIWQMDGLARLAKMSIKRIPNTDWALEGSGDFNRDGPADLLFRNLVTGQNLIWLMDGFSRIGSKKLTTTALEWEIKGIGDFNMDGQADIAWHNSSDGRILIWLMEGTTKKSAKKIGKLALAWKVVGVDDFNGDGKSDLLFRNSVDGRNLMWQMDGFAILAKKKLLRIVNLSWIVGGTGDFDRDGNADILWRQEDTGHNKIWFMDGFDRIGNKGIPRIVDTDWHVRAVRDFSGDAQADILFHHASTGRLLTWLMNAFVREASLKRSGLSVKWQVVP